nr:MAG TPA: hypothetical protein [Bacteriophage sp.]
MWVGIFTLHIHYCTNRGIINVTAMGKELPYSWLTARRMFSRTLKYISRYTTDILCLHIPPPHMYSLLLHSCCDCFKNIYINKCNLMVFHLYI